LAIALIIPVALTTINQVSAFKASKSTTGAVVTAFSLACYRVMAVRRVTLVVIIAAFVQIVIAYALFALTEASVALIRPVALKAVRQVRAPPSRQKPTSFVGAAFSRALNPAPTAALPIADLAVYSDGYCPMTKRGVARHAVLAGLVRIAFPDTLLTPTIALIALP
jgi:hypothetical protein